MFQSFGGVLDDAVQLVHAFCEDTQFSERSTYIGRVLHIIGLSYNEVARPRLAHGVKGST